MNTDSEIRHKSMVRMRQLASLLLVIMTGIFAGSVALESSVPVALLPYLPWIRAFSEAAMVGACADWFAVTALFRHPLGFPIPHTAIIPTNKERIGVTLGEFVQVNFLTPAVIGPKVNSARLTARFADWLAIPGQREEVTLFLGGALEQAVTSMNDDAIRSLFIEVSKDTIQGLDFALLSSRILDLLIADGKHTELLSSFLFLVEQATDKHHSFIRAKVRSGMPWWVPGFVRDKVYDQILGKFKEELHEINADPNHIVRAKITEALELLVEKLKSDQQTRAEAEKFKEWILTRSVASDYAAKLFEDLKSRLLEDLRAPESRTRSALDEILASLAEHLSKDIAAQKRIDSLLEQAAMWGAAQHGAQLTELIAETVRGWDTQTLVTKIESEVGRDLQFIRINGTIVGGLIGLLIHAAAILLN